MFVTKQDQSHFDVANRFLIIFAVLKIQYDIIYDRFWESRNCL